MPEIQIFVWDCIVEDMPDSTFNRFIKDYNGCDVGVMTPMEENELDEIIFQ